MEEMDVLEQESLRVEVFNHLVFARQVEPSADVLNKMLEIYNAMTQCPVGRMLDGIDYYRQEIARNYGRRVPDVSPTIYYSNVMWEYLYVLSYYFNYDDYHWKKHFLPRMKELARNNIIKDDMTKAEKLVNDYINKRVDLEMDLETNHLDTQQDTEEIKKLQQQITSIQEQLAQKDTIIAEKDARIKELEALLEHPHLSFIQTEGKSPQSIQWAYQDIEKAIKKPATMAACLKDLQIKGMLKGQERYGDLDNIKAMHVELKEKYGIKWTYAALCRALNREMTKKKRH